MDITTASQLLEENLHTIFAWSVTKLYDKTEAEDLAQDIVCGVLQSVHRLESDNAFWGFVWRIAENTLHARLRKKRPELVEWDESFCGAYWTTPEETVLQSDEIRRLRRELSLLSRQYREVTVRYYLYNKSCSEIATELDISEGMVKYYLFKTRKILKEGIGMTREFGEKSYNPQTFRMDFWGGDGNLYWKLFERKLPGNILLTAYDRPVTTTELSIELGVACTYLEDELAILEKHDFLVKTGDKYQTNIIIFTDEYEKRATEQFKPIYKACAHRISNQLDELFPTLKNLDFHGKGYSDNRLKWTFANLAMYHALCRIDESTRGEFGEYPLLSNASYGYLFGYDNDYAHHHFNGIYGNCENSENTAWISVENYRIIEKCQNLQPHNWNDTVNALTAATLCEMADAGNGELPRLIDEGVISSAEGKLSPNFPVFSEACFAETKALLAPIITEVCNCITQICDRGAELLKTYTPKALHSKCRRLSYIHHQMDVMAFIMETLVAEGWLIVPTEKLGLCMFGVRK